MGRLEEMKNRIHLITIKEKNWLIERIEELESENGRLVRRLSWSEEVNHERERGLEIIIELIKEDKNKIDQQNKRYREAINDSIKRIKDDGEYNQLHYDVESILNQALVGESNE